MGSVILKRGKASIELIKSDNLIALKPNGQTKVSNILSTIPETRNWEDTEKNIGGFRLVNLPPSLNLEKTLDEIRAHDLIDTGTHVYHTPQSEVPYVPTGKITLRFTPDSTQEQRHEILDKYKLEILNSRLKTNADGTSTETYIAGVTPDSPNPLKVAYDLQQSEIIQVAEPDLATPGKLAGFVLPTDNLLKEQWHLHNTGIQFGTSLGLKAGADARVVQAWENSQSLGSPSCIVAVIDDGFDLTHPDLSGNSKIVAPWDFKTNTNDPSPKAFNPDPRYGDYHGTACAGVAIGNSNATGVLGAAPNCRFMPVKWGQNLYDEAIEVWFGYVASHGAWIVSCSWGAAAPNYVLSTLQNEAIEQCAKEGRSGLGCVILFAAGNSNHDINDPAGGTVDGFAIHPDVIAVAASTSRDERADYSNFGKEISICAPSSGRGGRGILTTDVRGEFQVGGITFDAGYDTGDFTKSFGGTSSATPLVAGICALILSVNPSLTAKEVRKILEQTARPIGDLNSYKNGHSPYFGYGCINADAAVKAAMNQISKKKETMEITSIPLSLFQQEWWGISRHELIAGTADRLLSPQAKATVKNMLSHLDQSSLKEIAGWADQIKGADPNNVDPDTKEFLDKFGADVPRSWHYVGLPTGVDSYSRIKYPDFTKDDDVVQMISISIQVLQGTSDHMSKVNALRWLTHLVADIHQPVHVGCSFIDDPNGAPKLEFDPQRIRDLQLKSDRGGNLLILSIEGNVNLHSYWDSKIPEAAPVLANVHVLADGQLLQLNEENNELKEKRITKLTDEVRNKANNAAENSSNIPLHLLSEQWASESILKARSAYQSLAITEKFEEKYKVSWEGKSAYDARCSGIVSEQLRQAAERLAYVINNIFK